MHIATISKTEFIQQLAQIASSFDATKENYLKSYPYFLRYFEKLEIITLENLIIGISFTYSWMPTILKSINLEKADEVIFILNQAKKGKTLTASELGTLKSTFNNSLVGTSKLLHFINPEKYAIWDSKVYRFLNNTTPHKYRLEKPESYLEYLSFIETFKTEEGFTSFYNLMKEKVGFEISAYRALELAFFKG